MPTKKQEQIADQISEAASIFGRMGGQMKTKKKSDAARRNAAKATIARKRNAARRRKLKAQQEREKALRERARREEHYAKAITD